MTKELANLLQQYLPQDLKAEDLFEEPKTKEHGDISFPCFQLAKHFKTSPQQIAQDLSEKIAHSLPKEFEKVVPMGPYINFFLDNVLEAQKIANSFLDNSFYKYSIKKTQKIVVEYPSPNTNKALHIGHTRNMLLGTALCNVLSFVGHRVTKTNLNNDRGIAVCKAMLAYELWGNNETPQTKGMKPDQFVSYWYVKFGEEAKKNPELETQAQEMLVKWEAGDEEVRALWEKILNWVFQGYKQTYKNYHLPKFDKEFFESQIYDQGKELVIDALKSNVKGFKQEDDGAIYVDLEDLGYGKKYLLRGDGTTLYMTQDIYLATLKEKLFKADKYIFVVGQEQEYHFNVLFEILRRIFKKKSKNYHFAYGYVYDEQGKKFSSRLGNTIGADDILEMSIQKAKENLKQKELTKKLPEKEIDRRAQKIGFGALAFSFLKANPLSPINFSVNQALSFEGETGPYVQYTYARIQSLLKKGDFNGSACKDLSKVVSHWDVSLLSQKELEHIKLLNNFKEVIDDTLKNYKISSLAQFALRVAQSFNDLYQEVPFTKIDDKELKTARLTLAKSTADVIHQLMSLLSIDLLEQM